MWGGKFQTPMVLLIFFREVYQHDVERTLTSSSVFYWMAKVAFFWGTQAGEGRGASSS